MAHRSFLIVLSLCLLINTLGGCSKPTSNTGNSNNQTDQANADRAVEPGMEGAKDNADELETLVKLPYEPEDLVWKEFPAAADGSTARRVLAVFQFGVADAKKVVENASHVRPGSPVLLPTEKWFPKELITQTEVSGEEGIRATSYAADEFLNAPFNTGTLSRVDNTDFFVLEVFAK